MFRMSKLNAISKAQQGKTLLYVFMDIILINFSIILGITLWYGGTIPGLPGGKSVVINPEAWLWYSYAVIWVTPICVIVYGIFKFYSNIWKYASIDDVYKIVIADTIIFVSLYYIDRFFISKNVDFMLPRRMLLVAWIIDVVLFVFSRSGYRLIKKFFINLGNIISKKTGTKRVLVVGAGDAGYNVVKSIANGGKGYENKTAIIVVDDDFRKNNSNIMGVRVTYNCDSIPRLAKEYEIDEIIIAIPSANSVQTNRIIKKCTETNCALKMIPAISDISDGEYNSLRDLNITDLLFRDEVQIDVESIAKYITDKTVLVTGGGGSIGSELCRQIAKFNPKLLVIFDIYENNANMAGRRLRARILAILPPDLIDAAVKQCRKTLAGSADTPLEDRIQNMVAAFKKLSVRREMLEQRLGHDVSKSTNEELAELVGIYNSIKDHLTVPADWFDPIQDTQKTRSINDKMKEIEEHADNV